MKPNDFEIGKVYKDTRSGRDRFILVKITSERAVCLHEAEIGKIYEIKGFWGGLYEEIPLSDLTAQARLIYDSHFPESKAESEPADCTCSNDQIFNGGCKCGAFQKERA